MFKMKDDFHLEMYVDDGFMGSLRYKRKKNEIIEMRKLYLQTN